MRFLLCILLSTLCFACYTGDPDHGKKDQKCRDGITWAGPCDEGLRCVDNYCRECGDLDEYCCSIPGGSQTDCNPGVACDDMIDKIGTCTDTCGSPGLPCCDYDTCPNGGDCENGMCSGTPPPSPGLDCNGGQFKHFVKVITQDCTAVDKIFHTNTLEEAEACRQALVDAALPTEEICDLDEIPSFEPHCATSPFPPSITHELNYCSDAKLQACQEFWCAGPDCTWAPGECS